MKKSTIPAAIFWLKTREGWHDQLPPLKKETTLFARISALFRSSPVFAGVVLGLLGSFAVVLAFWALAWLIHWLPWPKG